MRPIEMIHGLWKVISYEQDGVQRSGQDLDNRAYLVLLSDILVTDSDGTWGEIKYHKLPTPAVADQSIWSLKQLVQGLEYPRSPDYHIYSGGVVRFGKTDDKLDCIDLVVYHGPNLYTSDADVLITRGLFRYDGVYLALCLADAMSKTRPTRWNSTDTRYQSLSVYVRVGPPPMQSGGKIDSLR